MYLVWEISTYNPLFIPEHVRWPSRVAVYLFLLSSAVWFKMVYSGISITASTLLLVAVSGWFTDLTLESTEGRVTIRVQNDIITGFKIFLISECMMFFCCFWGFIHMGLLPNIFILNNLPPISPAAYLLKHSASPRTHRRARLASSGSVLWRSTGG